MNGFLAALRSALTMPRLLFLAAGVDLGPNSIEKFWLEFWVEFWLEKSLEFWLEIPYTVNVQKWVV